MIFISFVFLIIFFIEIYQYHTNNNTDESLDKNVELQKMTISNLDDFEKKTIDKNIILHFNPGKIYTDDEESNVFIETKDDLILVRKNILYTIHKKFKVEVNLINLKKKFNFYYKLNI